MSIIIPPRPRCLWNGMLPCCATVIPRLYPYLGQTSRPMTTRGGIGAVTQALRALHRVPAHGGFLTALIAEATHDARYITGTGANGKRSLAPALRSGLGNEWTRKVSGAPLDNPLLFAPVIVARALRYYCGLRRMVARSLLLLRAGRKTDTRSVRQTLVLF